MGPNPSPAPPVRSSVWAGLRVETINPLNDFTKVLGTELAKMTTIANSFERLLCM